MDVLIDKRELLEKARERKLNLQILEKDYALINELKAKLHFLES